LSATPSATPNDFGSLSVMYSTNNGSSYATLKTISTDHIPSLSCNTVNISIPAGAVPSGNELRIRFSGTWNVGSYFIIIDDLSIVQSTTQPPMCDAKLTLSTHTQNVPVTTSHLTWTTATGVPTGYRLTV